MYSSVCHSSLWDKNELAMDKLMEEDRPFEGLILVGSPLLRNIRLSCVSNSSIIFPLWSFLCDPQAFL